MVTHSNCSYDICGEVLRCGIVSSLEVLLSEGQQLQGLAGGPFALAWPAAQKLIGCPPPLAGCMSSPASAVELIFSDQS